MRTIKFRVWKDEDKTWVSFPGKGLDSFEPIINVVYTDCEYFIIQQFTGIQDCNKKDLYEGDILKVKGYFKGEFEEFSIGVVEWDERDCGFHINIYKNGEPYWDIYHMNEIQERGEFFIVGNIFENGDLLK